MLGSPAPVPLEPPIPVAPTLGAAVPVGPVALSPGGPVNDPRLLAGRMAAARIEPPGGWLTAASAPLTIAAEPALITCWKGRAGAGVTRGAVAVATTLAGGPPTPMRVVISSFSWFGGARRPPC